MTSAPPSLANQDGLREHVDQPDTRGIQLAPQVLVVSHDAAFLHLLQMLLENLGVHVRTTMEWRKVPYLAAKLRASVAILDLTPASETACWLSVEALRARSRTIRVLMCPVAPWLIEGHRHQLDRLQASIWSGTFDLAELLQFVGTPTAQRLTGPV